MGLLLRPIHIWPLWDTEHFGGSSIMLAIASAGQEGPFTWTSMLLWTYYGSATDDRFLATQGRKLGLTRPKRLLGSFPLFLSLGLHGAWICFSLRVRFSLTLHTLLCRALLLLPHSFK